MGKTRFAQGKLLGLSNYLNADEIHQTHAEMMVNEAIKTSEIEGQILNGDVYAFMIYFDLVRSASGWTELKAIRKTDARIK